MKRLLLFLVLLAVGFAALRMAIDDGDGVRANANGQAKPEAPKDRPAPTTSGVTVQQGRINAEVTVFGPLQITRWKTIEKGNGHTIKEEAFVLTSGDSKPLGAGLQQVDQLEVHLFDDGRHSATLTATQALVELRQDANGKASLDEGKDIALRDTVLTTMPGSRMAGLRLELGDAKVRIEDEELVLTTLREQPVLVVLEGDRRVTLRGLGAQARLPRRRGGTLQRADVEILQQPELLTAGLQVRAVGRLHYVENVSTGAGQVTIDDQVDLDLVRDDLALPGRVRPAGATEVGHVRVRGDQFIGWLQRSKVQKPAGRERQQIDWRQLVLTGAPATVDVPGGRLITPRVTAWPGLFGEPFLITAHGGESRIEQTELRAGSKQKELFVGTAERRIHMVRPAEQVAALHRAFGFPRWTLRPLEEMQVAIGEGASRFTSGTRTVQASDGVRIYRRDHTETGVVRGLGKVVVILPARSPNEQDVVATGNDGFTLTSTATGDVLALGPEAPNDLAAAGPWRRHEFDIRQGQASLTGRGVCVIERTGERTAMRLLSPDASLVANVPASGLLLQRVRRLHATLIGNDVQALDVAGWPLQISMRRGGDTITAQAPRLLQLGPRSLRLLPNDVQEPAIWSGLAAVDTQPRLHRALARSDTEAPQDVTMNGPRIDVHHVGGRDAFIDATAVGDEQPRIYATIGQKDGKPPTTLACTADRLRVLPFLVSPEARAWHTAGHGVLAEMTFHSIGNAWLLVDEVGDFQLDDERNGHIEGKGQRLLVSHGGKAALFVGNPDTLTAAEVRRTQDGREITLRGARVRAIDKDDDGVHLDALGAFADRSTFLPPTLTLHERNRTGLFSHMQATCHGNIEVRPEAVIFLGPVTTAGLTANGELDANGMHIEARELSMVRARKTGDVTHVLGKDVVVDWTRLHAKCADVALDLVDHRLLATDPDDAVITLPDGREIRSPRIDVDYVTMAFRMFGGGRISRRAIDGERR